MTAIVQTSRQINLDVTDRIAREFNLNFKEAAAYKVMREFMDNDTFEAYPSVSTIADKLKVHRNTAKSYIGGLKEKGVMWVTHRKSAKNEQENDTNLYTFAAEKSGKAVKQCVVDTVLVEETTYEKTKRIADESKEKLSKKYNSVMSEFAFKAMASNIRRGATGAIKDVYAYMEAVIVNKLEESKIAKAQKQIALESAPAEEEVKQPKSRSSYTGTKQRHPVATKTKMHNFEQRSSKYSKQELEKMILDRQRK